MVRKVRCENGHWYDAEKYQECPHCAKEGKIPETADAAKPEREDEVIILSPKKKRGWFWKKRKNRRSDGDFLEKTEAFSDITEKDSNPEDLFHGESFTEEDEEDDIRGSEQSPSEEEQSSPHADAESDSQKTLAYYGAADTEPVVGWLVCIKGIYFGQEFRIKAGRNFVGRSVSMDICIMDDASVSREKHAILTFDPRSAAFGIQPGESGNLIYLNNQAVYERQELHKGDVLEIGRGSYLFVPLCGEEFSWDEYL